MSLPKPYYHDEKAGITIYCGDCREILPELPPVDLVLTDPPYGIDVDTSWLTALHVQRGKPANKNDARVIGDDRKIDLSLLWRFPKRVIWGFPYIVDPDATGWIVWDKQPGCDRRGIVSPVEMASTTCRKGFDIYRCMWGGYMRPRNEQRHGHPTEKPLQVCKLPIADWSKPSEIILDPFAGSGTTLHAAKLLGRRAIGIEIEEKYCEIAANRLSQGVLPFGDNEEISDALLTSPREYGK